MSINTLWPLHESNVQHIISSLRIIEVLFFKRNLQKMKDTEFENTLIIRSNKFFDHIGMKCERFSESNS